MVAEDTGFPVFGQGVLPCYFRPGSGVVFGPMRMDSCSMNERHSRTRASREPYRIGCTRLPQRARILWQSASCWWMITRS